MATLWKSSIQTPKHLRKRNRKNKILLEEDGSPAKNYSGNCLSQSIHLFIFCDLVYQTGLLLLDWRDQRELKIFPEAILPEGLGSELNDPSVYQPLFDRDLFHKRKIKELTRQSFFKRARDISTRNVLQVVNTCLVLLGAIVGLTGNSVFGPVGGFCGCDRWY